MRLLDLSFWRNPAHEQEECDLKPCPRRNNGPDHVVCCPKGTWPDRLELVVGVLSTVGRDSYICHDRSSRVGDRRHRAFNIGDRVFMGEMEGKMKDFRWEDLYQFLIILAVVVGIAVVLTHLTTQYQETNRKLIEAGYVQIKQDQTASSQWLWQKK